MFEYLIVAVLVLWSAVGMYQVGGEVDVHVEVPLEVRMTCIFLSEARITVEVSCGLGFGILTLSPLSAQWQGHIHTYY